MGWWEWKRSIFGLETGVLERTAETVQKGVCTLSQLQKLRTELKEAKRKGIVFSDVDLTQRWGKHPISAENVEGIWAFRERGGLVIPITGAPFTHIPHVLKKDFAFSESGAVVSWIEGDSIKNEIIAPQESIWALEELQLRLGVSPCGGWNKIQQGYVFVEGPRRASLTLVSGYHPHAFPSGMFHTVSLEVLEYTVGSIIEENGFPLQMRIGEAKEYQWVDVLCGFEKHHAVEFFLKETGFSSIYYLGDGANDLKAMQLSGVVPVGFRNSIAEVRETVYQRGGIYIDKNGPDGGAADALYAIMGSL
jgi:hypothetical protein